MTYEEKRIAIAQACGFLFDENGTRSIRCNRWGWPIPDYFGSLDAMHEAEEVLLQKGLWVAYSYRLGWTAFADRRILRATAEQRAEAFGLALGLWKEGE